MAEQKTGTITLNKDKKQAASEMNGVEAHAPIVIDDQTIEPVLALEGLDAIAAHEKFMQEKVEVIIAETTDENAVPIIILNVNGINQPVARGVPTTVRRCFVEVLARCKETKYTQVQDKFELDRSELRGRTALAFPFQMLDTNPKGMAWLKAIMAEAG